MEIRHGLPVLELDESKRAIITPAVEILKQSNNLSNPASTFPVPSIRKSLDELFPEQKYEERNVKDAKEILGELANEFTPQQLKDSIVEIKYLTECWLDEFEREVFKGKTLRELLHEKGGL